MSILDCGRYRVAWNRISTRKAGRPVLIRILSCVVILSAIIGCSGDDEGPPQGPQVDTTPPAVVSISPMDGATGVSLTAKVSVTFSENLDSLTIDTATFRVSDVGGTVSCGGACAEFTPSAPMDFNSMHFVTITTGVTDKAGNHLAERFTSCFRTVVSSENPAANAGVDTVAGLDEIVALDGTASSDPNSLPLTYHWSQVYGPAVTWVGDSEVVSPNFLTPDTVSTMEFRLIVQNGLGRGDTDYVCVMVLEDKEHAFWVSGTIGVPGNPGTRTLPFAGIQQAIGTAAARGDSADVYIEAGTYNETLTLQTGISIYGGYQIEAGSVWRRNIASGKTTIAGGTTAVSGSSIRDVVLDGLDISSATPSTPGASSIVLSLNNSDNIVISRNSLLSGSGAGGADGTVGVAGANGNSGGNGNSWMCGSDRAGGAGGPSTIGCAGGYGGTGRGTTSDAGAAGSGPRVGCPGGGGGAGGCGVFPNTGSGGGAGGNGSAGSDGNGGSSVGTLANGVYLSANGAAGGQGLHGCGGGGGGGGGGDCWTCCGGGGGGGGAGGEGGKGGSSGQGGGGSLGIVLTNCSHVSAIQNVVIAASGGKGGSGGPGGAGGAGGIGGTGGAGDSDGNPAGGGNGGKGGNGGAGGFGGGGGGGPSICIAMDSQSAEITISSNTYQPGTAGSGGSGGAAPSSHGADGVSAETIVF